MYSFKQLYMHVQLIQTNTVDPLLSESPLSEPSVIRTLFSIIKSLKMTSKWFSVKISNKWNACVILGLLYHSS